MCLDIFWHQASQLWFAQLSQQFGTCWYSCVSSLQYHVRWVLVACAYFCGPCLQATPAATASSAAASTPAPSSVQLLKQQKAAQASLLAALPTPAPAALLLAVGQKLGRSKGAGAGGYEGLLKSMQEQLDTAQQHALQQAPAHGGCWLAVYKCSSSTDDYTERGASSSAGYATQAST
jgi:hypothetical protein